MANQIKIKETPVHIGDTVTIQQKIQEGAKARLQNFEGILIAIKGRGENKMFTVRKIAVGGIGVERIWPVNSPWISQVTVQKKGNVRRAKLYYLRQRIGRRATLIRERRQEKPKAPIKPVVKAKSEKPAVAKKPAAPSTT
ncbi:50S ribosomal protein L19 [Candidatus Shapirobacteria bacterium CG10_big_fil_rev_8_21_14_0_10_48_15]|uniref:50S ribosomal protein L19 n=1 Tax=Candidatus Shapirobacteria bacterium CG10_big_fil_rev_8_21_14_0_10_48_15 TaxID=1974484 RepID=A0A2M8L7U1_9BACT|nr:MAG: 50S ribosomal protein L19 [Candidatus Shapirobacteria bacterium CG10_big_fil_rev_8_21_14_0_10_48_15]